MTQGYRDTMELCWFVVEGDVVVNPFDFVSVDNINNSISIGIVKDIQSVVVEGRNPPDVACFPTHQQLLVAIRYRQ